VLTSYGPTSPRPGLDLGPAHLDGGLGLAGVIAAGAAGAWSTAAITGSRCPWRWPPRRAGLGQAIAVWATGSASACTARRPGSRSPVAIGPARRPNGYESFATFQPVFLYESLWDLLVAAGVAYAIRRFALTGDRAFALYAGLYAAGRLGAEAARIDFSAGLEAPGSPSDHAARRPRRRRYLVISRARRRRDQGPPRPRHPRPGRAEAAPVTDADPAAPRQWPCLRCEVVSLPFRGT